MRATLALALLCGIASTAEGARMVPPSRLARCVAVLPMRGEMDAIAIEGLCQRASDATAAGADAIAISFDTPGGEVTGTLELCRRIKSEFPANTIAWVNPRAFSAGTIAALACREIVVTRDAVFGDAAPIAISPFTGLQSLAATERAKLEAPLLSEVTDSARRRGHDERLCRAFISAPEALWLLEDPERGERFIVGAEEFERVFGEAPPRDATRQVPGGANPAPWITDALRRPATETAGDALQALPRGRAPLEPADASRLRVVSQLDRADELLTLRAPEALALGVAKGEVADESALRAFLGAERSFTLEPRWSEPVARLLTSGWVRMFLVIALVACFAGEMLAPGLGMFSIGGLCAAALLAIGPMLAGLATWWPGLALMAGLGLIAAELLLLPGSLVTGAVGAVAFAAGTIGLFVVSDPSPDPTRGVMQGLLTLVGAIGAAALVAWRLSRGEGGLLRRAVLQAQLTTAGAAPTACPIGAEGDALTDLRPVGRVLVAGVAHDARANAWLARGARVRVVESRGNELLVEAIP